MSNPVESVFVTLIDTYHKVSSLVEDKLRGAPPAHAREEVLLLGQGWFAKGFMEHIDHRRFAVRNIARHPFVNTPMMLANVLRDSDSDSEGEKAFWEEIAPISRFRRRFQEESLGETIQRIDLANELVITDKSTHSFQRGVLVCGLGSHVDNALYWKKNIKSLQDLRKNSSNKPPAVCIIGAGLSGTELAFYLSDKQHRITLYDGLPLPRLYEYLSPEGKTHVLQRITDKQIYLVPGQLFDNKEREKFDLVVFATGSRPNALTADWKVSPRLRLESHPRVYAGGDGVHSSYPRTAQVAYEQGKYIARSLNGEINEDFSFCSKGVALYCGDSQYYTEVNIGPREDKAAFLNANPGRLPNLLVHKSTQEQKENIPLSAYNAQLLLNVHSDLLSFYYKIFK